MTCQDAVALFSESLEAAPGAEALAELEQHLDECAPCVAYLNTLRATRRAAAAAAPVEMPEEMKARLRSFLLDRLR